MKKLLVLAAAGLSLAPLAANAQLAHRYDFTAANQGKDTVGTANGTLAGGATITNGLLTTTGAAGSNLTLPPSVGTGITGSFSIETYVTRNESGGNFSSLFSFASDQNNFILTNPDRSGFGTSANFRATGFNNGNEFQVFNGLAFPQGTQQQVVVTYNSGTGTVSLYLNGAFASSGTFGLGLNFQTITAGGFDGIGGNAPFTGDQTFNGTTDDFRIYGQALTASQVTSLNTAGPNATNAAIAVIVPEPSTWAMMSLGLVALCGLQRFRRRQA